MILVGMCGWRKRKIILVRLDVVSHPGVEGFFFFFCNGLRIKGGLIVDDYVSIALLMKLLWRFLLGVIPLCILSSGVIMV